MDTFITILINYLPGILQAVFCALVGWIYWSAKRLFVTQEACKRCRDEVDGSLNKLLKEHQESDAARKRLEMALADLPTSRDIQTLALSLKGFEGDIKGLTAQMESQGRAIGRMEKNVDMLTSVHLGNG